MSNENKTRKSPVTHQTLTIAALMGKDLGPMLVNHTDPVGVLEKVIATVEAEADRADLVESLTDLRQTFIDAKGEPGQKGRKAPIAGEVRAYNAQQIAGKEGKPDGDLFIRLPVGLLNVAKGKPVFVTFGEDGFSVSSSDPRLSAQ